MVMSAVSTVRTTISIAVAIALCMIVSLERPAGGGWSVIAAITAIMRYAIIRQEERNMDERYQIDRPLGKRMAKYGAVGAIIAIPVPFIGPIIGAAAGAGYAYFKTKRGR